MVAERDPNEKLYRLKLLIFRCFAITLAATMLLSVLWVSMLAYDVDWIVREVDEATVTCCPALAETATGGLLMAYGSSEGLMLATEDDGAWSVSPVMASGAGAEAFQVNGVAVAVDSSGRPHIASICSWLEAEYYSLTRLVYSEPTASGWENTLIDEDVQTSGVSIAVDSDSNAHISYAAPGNMSHGALYSYNFTYATDSTGEWSIYDISSRLQYSTNFWVRSSICVDDDGTPHIASLTQTRAGYITNLTGTPDYEVISYWDPRSDDVYPSHPSILVGSDDVVHVLCLGETLDVIGGEIAKTVVHFKVSDGSGSYENATIESSTDFSRDMTQTVMDPDGRFRIFYNSGQSLGVVTLAKDGAVSEEPIHQAPDWTTYFGWYGISVVVRGDGETVISNPYGCLGYLTDSFDFDERLSVGVGPAALYLVGVIAVVVLLSVVTRYSRAKLIEESKWHKTLKE